MRCFISGKGSLPELTIQYMPLSELAF